MSLFGERVVSGSSILSHYDFQRSIGEGKEQFMFNSIPAEKRLFRRAPKSPSYMGNTAINGHSARFEIAEASEDTAGPLVAHYMMTPEVSFYARSDIIEVRTWAGSVVTSHLLRRYLEGELVNDGSAEEYWESLTPEVWEKINEYATSAV